MSEENLEPDEEGASDNSLQPEISENQEASSQAGWGNLSESDLKVVEDKGWKSPQDLLKSYQEMEKLSSNKISIPKADDEEGWKKLNARLGCPETIDGFEISDVAEADKPFIDDFKKVGLETGLRSNQVDKIYQWYKARQEKAVQDFNAQVEKDKEEVKAEWGDDYSKNEALMQRGVRILGLEEDALTNIEVAIGTKAFMNMLKRFGEMASEDTAKGLSGQGSIPSSEEMSTEDWISSILKVNKSNS